MLKMVVPVVFVIAQGKAGLFFHAKHIGQLDKASLSLVSGRLAHTDKAASVVYKFLDAAGDDRILPPGTAGMRSVRIPDIEDHIHIFQHIRVVQDILEA